MNRIGMLEFGCELLDLLDRPDDLARAIEEQLIGPNLLELVGTLEIFHPAPSQPVRIPTALVERVLEHGLTGLSDEEFQALLQQPHGLLQLQKAVLSERRPYWDEVASRTAEPLPSVDVDWPVPAQPARPWYRSPWAWTTNVMTGLAASVAFIVLVAIPRRDALRDEETKLHEATALNDSLKRELAGLQIQRLVDPFDLPERLEHVVKLADPTDLPDGDPDDLPDGPGRPRQSI